MWQILLGLGIGVYIGTYYNCKPVLLKVGDIFTRNFPPRDNE
jgi:hypothetical protein